MSCSLIECREFQQKKKCHNDRGSKIFSNMLDDVVNVQMLGKPVAFDKFLLGF